MKTTYTIGMLKTTEEFVGESLEDKVRRITETNAPIEAVSPMYYTERKDGVKPETDIRTDKWDMALGAMTTIAEGTRKHRQMRMDAATDKPDASSEMNVQK